MSAISRRTFIRRVAAGSGGLALGLWVAACTDDAGPPPSTTAGGDTPVTLGAPSTSVTSTILEGAPDAIFEPDVLLQIDGSGAVSIVIPKSEMGQGVRTALAMAVAEELDADWAQVHVETAPGDRSYGDQVTGGSLSVSTRFEPMRRVGATARIMLIAAAAERWGIDPSTCITEPGVVVDRDGGRRASYGALAERAARLDVPHSADVALKHPADFRIVGRPTAAVDAPDMVGGRAIYASDVRIPDMVYGVVARPPVFGADLVGFDASAALTVSGVIDAVEISTGVGVVADTTWAALQGREVLDVTWEGGEDVDDAALRAVLRERLAEGTVGEGEIVAEYSSPFFAHAAMETLTSVADVRSDRAEVWAGSQDPQLARAVAGRGSGMPTERVTLHVPLIGGGFGRRLEQGFVEEAAELSAVVGRPVKLFWDRTDDLRHDRLHPATISRAAGNPADPRSMRVETVLATSTPVPTGDWRSVTNAPEAFARESFLDELALAARVDPYEYRLPLLDDRERVVLDRAADAAGWSRALPAGSGRGIAHHSTWGVTPTAVVVEVAVDAGVIRLVRVVCAIDCGTVVNPDGVTAQVEGGVAFAATAVLLGGVIIVGGGVAQTNFGDAPILRFDEMPAVEVIMIESDAPPTGVGESAVPPVAPAIANAVFAATGSRVRDLPLRLG